MARSLMPEIVATLGPASLGLAPALGEAGATALRLNASHTAPEELGHLASEVRRALPDTSLIVDLQGAKMRLGHFEERRVIRGQQICFSLCGDAEAISLPHPELFASVEGGDTLGCDDDRMRFRVDRVSCKGLDATALTDGMLRPRNGVNILEHPVKLDDLTETDLACVLRTVALPPVSYSYSFMSEGSEAEWIRRRAPGCPVIGKIERREAVENVTSISEAVDAVWICRGDLAAQLGTAPMARWIAAFDPRALPGPVLMAGQVLEHLTHHPQPTRSEVCHLFDLMNWGYAGCVLADETAVGRDPVNAVRTLKSLLDSFRGPCP